MLEELNKVDLLLNCAACEKKSAFLKSQERSNGQFEMNKIINKFLIAVEKFMLELRLKLPRFIDSVC